LERSTFWQAVSQLSGADANVAASRDLIGSRLCRAAKSWSSRSNKTIWRCRRRRAGALGRKGEALADFQKATALAEQIAGADPNNADWEQVLLWSEWRLSEQGDASAARLGDMTARMRKLKTENRLSADLVRLLPIAEGRLAKLYVGGKYTSCRTTPMAEDVRRMVGRNVQRLRIAARLSQDLQMLLQ
jgi:hypothetical protein